MYIHILFYLPLPNYTIILPQVTRINKEIEVYGEETSPLITKSVIWKQKQQTHKLA